MVDYLWWNVYVYPPISSVLFVGDTSDPSGFAIAFDSPAAIFSYLPTGGQAAALTSEVVDPSLTNSGAFGGDVVALQLDVDFSDSYALMTCSPPGSANSNGSPIAGVPCPWQLGDMLTYGQVEWISEAHTLLGRLQRRRGRRYGRRRPCQ
jgi:hypothetical protein